MNTLTGVTTVVACTKIEDETEEDIIDRCFLEGEEKREQERKQEEDLYGDSIDDYFFKEEDLKNPKFKGWSINDLKPYLHRQYLINKGWDNFTKHEKSWYSCSGYNCICGGLQRYGYCREYDYQKWKECNDRAKRNREIWSLFNPENKRGRAQSETLDNLIDLPYALCGKKIKSSKIIMPRRNCCFKKRKNTRSRRNKTY